MALRPKVLLALVLLLAFMPIRLGAPLGTPPADEKAPPTVYCSMPTPTPISLQSPSIKVPLTTVAPPTSLEAPPTVSVILEAPPIVSPTTIGTPTSLEDPNTVASDQSLQAATETATPIVTTTLEAPPTQVPATTVEEDPVQCWKHIQNCTPPTLALYRMMSDYSETVPAEEAFWKMEALFNEVFDCLAPSQCSEIKTYREVFVREQMDHWNRFVGFEEVCLPKVFKVVYDGEHNCSANYDFVDTIPSTKFDIFLAGKSCFLELVTHECSNLTSIFLEKNYDSVIRSYTLDVFGEHLEEAREGKCLKGHDDFTRLQCGPLLEDWKEKMILLEEDEEAASEEMMELCGKVEACIENMCPNGADGEIKHSIRCPGVDDEPLLT